MKRVWGAFHHDSCLRSVRLLRVLPPSRHPVKWGGGQQPTWESIFWHNTPYCLFAKSHVYMISGMGGTPGMSVACLDSACSTTYRRHPREEDVIFALRKAHRAKTTVHGAQRLSSQSHEEKHEVLPEPAGVSHHF